MMLVQAGTQPLETARLRLRRFEPRDMPSMLQHWISDPLVQHAYMEPVWEDMESLAPLLGQYEQQYQNSDFYRWAIILKSTGECIGQIAYFLIDQRNHFGEIEYCVGRAFQRQGFACEASRAIIDFGFTQIGLNKVQICHSSSNIASKKVIIRCGFRYEGTLRDYFFLDGRYEDRLYYSILRSEYALMT